MIKQSISKTDVLNLLNELVEIDRDAMLKLLHSRVTFKEQMRDHPTVQMMIGQDGPSVGLLGILNGLFGVDENGNGPFCAVVDKDGQLIGFFRTDYAIERGLKESEEYPAYRRGGTR